MENITNFESWDEIHVNTVEITPGVKVDSIIPVTFDRLTDPCNVCGTGNSTIIVDSEPWGDDASKFFTRCISCLEEDVITVIHDKAHFKVTGFLPGHELDINPYAQKIQKPRRIDDE